MTDSELRALLLDCLALWDRPGQVTAMAHGLEIIVGQERFHLQRAPAEMRPVRWLLQTPKRRAAARPPRALPSVVALLAALRNALGAEGGNGLRIGAPG
ncbi:MAG: hypothetical protein WDN25_06740 [Acetobacteraceae bacterium]